MHQSIPAAPFPPPPPRANLRAPGISTFFVLGGKFPGVGMKEESKSRTPGDIVAYVLNAEYIIDSVYKQWFLKL